MRTMQVRCQCVDVFDKIELARRDVSVCVGHKWLDMLEIQSNILNYKIALPVHTPESYGGADAAV